MQFNKNLSKVLMWSGVAAKAFEKVLYSDNAGYEENAESCNSGKEISNRSLNNTEALKAFDKALSGCI